jgi:hypothetical protein
MASQPVYEDGSEEGVSMRYLSERSEERRGCIGVARVLIVYVPDLQQAERAKIPKKICNTVRRPRITLTRADDPDVIIQPPQSPLPSP